MFRRCKHTHTQLNKPILNALFIFFKQKESEMRQLTQFALNAINGDGDWKHLRANGCDEGGLSWAYAYDDQVTSYCTWKNQLGSSSNDSQRTILKSQWRNHNHLYFFYSIHILNIYVTKKNLATTFMTYFCKPIKSHGIIF